METDADPKSGPREERAGRGEGEPWREEEVKALLSVWREREAWREPDGRPKFEAISARLRELGVARCWAECQSQCRATGLQGWKLQLPGAAHHFSPGGGALTDVTTVIVDEGPYDLEEEDHIAAAHNALLHPQEDSSTALAAALPYVTYTGTEGGRHWSDKEVRALLCVWADRWVQEQLQSSFRNKAIFQEMARRLRRQFGVVRDWKQCRTKYKNLKYEYKVCKGGQGAPGPGRNMRFFAEIDAILQSGVAERSGNGESETRTGPGGEQAAVPRGSDGSHQVIKIDDAPQTPPSIPVSSDPPGVITVHDSGRNWSDEEMAALIRIWSEEGILRQLRSSTRNKDIFVQISRRLLQQGVERDWRQCRTKFKNLKYLYRSLQRGRDDIGDPRRIMRFYDQLDALMNGTERDLNPLQFAQTDVLGHHEAPSAQGREEWSLAHTPPDIDGYKHHIMNEPSMMRRPTGMENQPMTDGVCRRSDEAPGVGNVDRDQSDTTPVVSDSTTQTLTKEQAKPHGSIEVRIYEDGPPLKKRSDGTEASSTRRDMLASRVRKRRAPYEDSNLPSKRFQLSLLDGDSGSDCSETIGIQCKEESDHYIPIIEISSVRSMAAQALPTELQEDGDSSDMASASELKLGQKLNEGKTKQIIELPEEQGYVLVQSKDQITAGNAVRKDQMEGKAAIANKTTCCVFQLLQEAGIKTAFARQHSETAFVAAHCEMIPIEWVCRRVATGSFLKRNPGVKEGYRFAPLKMEIFFKDDANNDPQWSEEQLIAANLSPAGLPIGRCEVDMMSHSTVAIFEILEKAWATQTCTLVDMKIEFGVNVSTKEIVLADVIDNDSWRLWPAGDRSQQKDKQVYRDLKEVTPEAMQMVKRNFEWVSDRVKLLLDSEVRGRVVVLMGSTSDMAHCERIRKACASYGVPCTLRVTSAHKGPDETLRIKAEYEGDGVPTIFVAVAGRSNGLGPVMSGNTAYPVINCPPITPDWGAQDVWSSLRMPSGLGCSTVLSPDAAAQSAAQVLGLSNHLIWAKLRASMLNTWVALKLADQKLQQCSL